MEQNAYRVLRTQTEGLHSAAYMDREPIECRIYKQNTCGTECRARDKILLFYESLNSSPFKNHQSHPEKLEKRANV